MEGRNSTECPVQAFEKLPLGDEGKLPKAMTAVVNYLCFVLGERDPIEPGYI
jgi:hypothetical protein